VYQFCKQRKMQLENAPAWPGAGVKEARLHIIAAAAHGACRRAAAHAAVRCDHTKTTSHMLMHAGVSSRRPWRAAAHAANSAKTKAHMLLHAKVLSRWRAAAHAAIRCSHENNTYINSMHDACTDSMQMGAAAATAHRTPRHELMHTKLMHTTGCLK